MTTDTLVRNERIRSWGADDRRHWQEDGCDLHPTCFTCPLPACRYEMVPGRARQWFAWFKVEALLRSGLTLREAAERLEIPIRTAYHLRALARKGG
jgi:hypothetical protein